ncbi:MAG: ABC-type transport auxiliary lipoprotein family protein [Kordiimonas sp.]
MSASSKIKTLLLSSLLMGSVAGCGPLISFGGDGEPDETYGLRYEAKQAEQFPAGPIVYVDSPQMAEGLDGHGVTVVMQNGRRTVLERAAWSTHLSDLIRDYVAQSIGAQSGANMIGEGGLDITAGCRLGLKVWSFEFVPGEVAAEDGVSVVLQFSLVRISDNQLLSHPTFAASVTVDSNSVGGVMSGFSRAMDQASSEYGGWFRERMGQCSR